MIWWGALSGCLSYVLLEWGSPALEPRCTTCKWEAGFLCLTLVRPLENGNARSWRVVVG